jgi:hypothetical protein
MGLLYLYLYTFYCLGYSVAMVTNVLVVIFLTMLILAIKRTIVLAFTEICCLR